MAGRTVQQLEQHIVELSLFARHYSSFFQLLDQDEVASLLQAMRKWTTLKSQSQKQAHLNAIEQAYETVIKSLAQLVRSDGATAIILAASNTVVNFDLTVNALLEQGADINVCAQDNTYAGFLAVRNGNMDLIDTCIRNKANLNTEYDNLTPYDWAVYFSEQGHPDIKTRLEDANYTARGTGGPVTVANTPFSATNKPPVSAEAFDASVSQLLKYIEYRPLYFQFLEAPRDDNDNTDTKQYRRFFHEPNLGLILEWKRSRQADQRMPKNLAAAKRQYDLIIAKLADITLRIVIGNTTITTTSISDMANTLGLDLIASELETYHAGAVPQPHTVLNKQISQMQRFIKSSEQYFTLFDPSIVSTSSLTFEQWENTQIDPQTAQTAYDKVIDAMITFEQKHPHATGSVALAASYGHDAIVNSLLAKGADVNRPIASDDPSTALITACRSQVYAPIVKACIEHKANVQTTYHNFSALDYALQNSIFDYAFTGVVVLLETAGATYHMPEDSVKEYEANAKLRHLEKMQAALPELTKTSRPASARQITTSPSTTRPKEGKPEIEHPHSPQPETEMRNIDHNSDNENDSERSSLDSSLFDQVLNPNKNDVARKKWWVLLKEGLSTAINYSNRQLFEGLFDFVFNRKATWHAYRYPTDDKRKPRFFLLAAITAVLGVSLRIILLPLTTLIYDLSRISLIILNKPAYKHNPAKAWLMLAATAITTATLLSVGLAASAFTPHALQFLSATFGFATGLGSIGAVTMGALIAASLATIGMAILLHTAKKMAQYWNAKHNMLSPPPGCAPTAPKYGYHFFANHVFTNDEERNGNAAYTCAYESVLFTYYGSIKRPGISGASTQQKLFKQALSEFGKVREASAQNSLTQDEYTALIDSVKPLSFENDKGRASSCKNTLENLEVNSSNKIALRSS